jgi:hypothetical protein
MIQIPMYLFVIYNFAAGALIMLLLIWAAFRPNKDKED